ncbi:DUF1566 domain-containing protein [Desulfurivibrio alkaliphilus]|uniref:Lcl C-terminal domain-containing protein n=1 Tax=Desulfurivibrio alkaliphilus (strain DSM 19089 / UNIQEM U267 / AHT2) TaxID=589865 RepID=D6Z466_DESAT|nr:DUF1566 domain-containing protein [Desulfurivibrio alkaliphilus]ADH86341.1 conserved hypothetical protein [Desulfurivibrio alkaliphilus AHT 2]
MGLAEKLGAGAPTEIGIDWDITPADTFGIFESWGGKFRVRSKSERYYYFYIDGWADPPRLLFVERGVKHARILAHIMAPQELIDTCVAGQGKGLLDKHYAINEELKQWLVTNVLEGGPPSLVVPHVPVEEPESMDSGLPGPAELPAPRERLQLRRTPDFVAEEGIPELLEKFNFFDAQRRPSGSCRAMLVDNGDGLTVSDLKGGTMWQRGGCDITNHRHVAEYIEELNQQHFAGYDDWRLPTMEEALALLGPERNRKGLLISQAFSQEQPFIFLADQRKPGGFWFIDFKQGTVFWASGTIPGGFGRAVRTL